MNRLCPALWIALLCCGLLWPAPASAQTPDLAQAPATLAPSASPSDAPNNAPGPTSGPTSGLTSAPVLAPDQPLALGAAPALDAYNQQRRSLNEAGMSVLMGWAALNMLAGAAGWATSQGRWRAFHQMNLGWNLVNATIGVLGYLDATRPSQTPLGLAQTLAEGASIQKILMINLGLDVAYMATGAWLWERGLRLRDERFVGFGRSLILQGGFLFAFDLALVLGHQRRFDALLPQLQLSPQSMGLLWSTPF